MEDKEHIYQEVEPWGRLKSENGKLTYPLRSVAPRPPILEGQRGLSIITHFLPLRQGAKRVVRRMTECHSVPSEGSTTQCDAGKSEGEGV